MHARENPMKPFVRTLFLRTRPSCFPSPGWPLFDTNDRKPILWLGLPGSSVMTWFVVIFGINTMSDISKLSYVISRAVRRVKFETIWNITSGIYAKYYVQIMLLFVYTTTRKGFVIFTCRYFKLSWNTTALSQSNCRNFSFSGKKHLIIV